MPCHGLGGAYRSMTAKKLVNSLCLIGIAHKGGGGMGIDVVYILGLQMRISQGSRHRGGRSLYIGGGDMPAIGGEAIANDLRQDRHTASLRTLIGL